MEINVEEAEEERNLQLKLNYSYLHTLVLVGHHLGNIHCHILHINTMGCEVLGGVIVHV